MRINSIYKRKKLLITMKNIFIILISALVLISGCSLGHHDEHENEHGHEDEHEDHHGLGEISNDDKISLNSNSVITTTFFPIQEITQAIVADKAQVNVIVGLGIDPHSFEPTARQLVELSNSQLYIGLGGMFESIEEELLEANEDILSFDAAHQVKKMEYGEDRHEAHDEHKEEGHDDHHEEEAQHDEHGHESLDYDPHVWLSIENMKIMTNEILENLIILVPEYEQEFRVNAQTYIEQLSALEVKYNEKLTTCNQNVIIVNHKAFGYLAETYNFEQVSIAGFSPESEPTPQTLQKVIDEANEHDLSYVFSEGQLDSKVSETIAKDIEGKVLELNPLKTNSEETYFTIMEANLENLALGLEC